jgi:acyl-CoA thioesterase-2
MWIRLRHPIPKDEISQIAGLAYISDWRLAPMATAQHVDTIMDDSVMLASLDHAMWFHRRANLDEWLLLEVDSPFASGARGLLQARIYDRQRRLVASIAQEALIRPLQDRKRT